MFSWKEKNSLAAWKQLLLHIRVVKGIDTFSIPDVSNNKISAFKSIKMCVYVQNDFLVLFCHLSKEVLSFLY